jgi:hypothetical protein
VQPVPETYQEQMEWPGNKIGKIVIIAKVETATWKKIKKPGYLASRLRFNRR